VFGVITPLVAADITGRGEWFNLRMGILGLATGGAATVSNAAAGAIASSLGVQTAFIALALAALVASHGEGTLAEVYQRLVARGKKPIVAITAVMRKLIVIANAKLRDVRAENGIQVS
jgi:hypothetical protein